MRPSAVFSVVDQSVDAIIHIDVDGVIQGANEAAANLFGTEGCRLHGRHIAELVPEESRDDLLALLADVLCGQRIRPFDMVCVRCDGSPVHTSISVSPVRDSKGRTAGAAAIIRDISERVRETEEAARRQRLEAVGRLAGGVAHDFNNILMAILGHAEMALMELPADSDIREDIEAIVESVERASELTNQLLAFSRERSSALRTVDVSESVARVVRLLRRLIPEHTRVEMRASVTGAVRIDPMQFEQVLVNIAVNASDAMPDGGRIAIEAIDVLHVGSDRVPPGEYVVVRVSDTGVGMTEEECQRAFEPFFTTKPPSAGSGLGLSVAYGIVRDAGGYIVVDSAPGCGTRVELWLPRAAPATSGDADTVDLPIEALTVLVVEDDEAVREVAVRVLRQLGHRVLAAENGAAALEVARTFDGAIDLAITDAVMPVMGGREFVLQFRELRPECRVLMMSGYTGGGDIDDLIADQTVRLLRKPFSAESLERAIREAIRE
ncbi:MAG: PAS domain-containing hybrid sensor histidine kinase/response regulator [Deltaproteobacteria bacterium]|nr:MAG: PAS domain-containing hybrid sensor histidine kinase/response regulator [Deltaproteobacteria bacterium]